MQAAIPGAAQSRARLSNFTSLVTSAKKNQQQTNKNNPRALKREQVGNCPQSSGLGTACSLPRAWIQSLVGEERSHKPRGTAQQKAMGNRMLGSHFDLSTSSE